MEAHPAAAACHSLRDALATHLIDDGHDVEPVHDLPGFTDAATAAPDANAPGRAGAPITMAPGRPAALSQNRSARAARAEAADHQGAGEVNLSRDRETVYHLYRVFEFRRSPGLNTLNGPIERVCSLAAFQVIARVA